MRMPCREQGEYLHANDMVTRPRLHGPSEPDLPTCPMLPTFSIATLYEVGECSLTLTFLTRHRPDLDLPDILVPHWLGFGRYILLDVRITLPCRTIDENALQGTG